MNDFIDNRPAEQLGTRKFKIPQPGAPGNRINRTFADAWSGRWESNLYTHTLKSCKEKA